MHIELKFRYQIQDSRNRFGILFLQKIQYGQPIKSTNTITLTEQNNWLQDQYSAQTFTDPNSL